MIFFLKVLGRCCLRQTCRISVALIVFFFPPLLHSSGLFFSFSPSLSLSLSLSLSHSLTHTHSLTHSLDIHTHSLSLFLLHSRPHSPSFVYTRSFPRSHS